MTPQILLLLIILVIALVLFWSERVPADVVALGIVLLLTFTELLPRERAFAGFGSDTVIMILGLLILTAALERTGVVDLAGRAGLRHAGDNPDRMHSEASFAALCGVRPIEASSGKTRRHRLNRGGDRDANAALYRVALTRSRGDQRTRDYLDRRAAQGMTRREATRCLKRYIAREIYRLLQLKPADQALETS